MRSHLCGLVSARRTVKWNSGMSLTITTFLSIFSYLQYRQTTGGVLERKFSEEMRAKLLDLKREILEHLATEDEEFKRILHDEEHKDFGDIATDDIDRKMLEALGAKEQKRLNLIESALYQIDNGRYGKCISCDAAIPEGRLRAIPYAMMCLDCKSRDERRNR